MSNQTYPKWKEFLMQFLINNTIKCALIDTTKYTINLSTDTYLSDIPSAAIIAEGAAMASISVTLAVFNANNYVWPSVTGSQAEAIVIYQDSGVASTSRLIAYIDTMTGLPVTPNGADIECDWDTGANHIFHL
jgi:hypothetical protein